MKVEDYFKGKSVLITGAASGIGRELCLRLAPIIGQGLALDRNAEGLQSLKRELGGAVGKFHFEAADIREPEALEKVFPSSQFSPDIIIANAGLGGVNPANAFDLELDRKIMEVNYFGSVHTVYPYLGAMKKRQSGHLVFVASLAGLRGMPQASSYSASKAAQIALAESFRFDLAPFGISVTVVMPGFIATPMANHKEFDKPFTISTAKCVQIILQSVAGKCKLVRFPWPMALLAWCNRLFPAWLSDFIGRRATKGQIKDHAVLF
jgi:short-subunit dehydrogenase